MKIKILLIIVLLTTPYWYVNAQNIQLYECGKVVENTLASINEEDLKKVPELDFNTILVPDSSMALRYKIKIYNANTLVNKALNSKTFWAALHNYNYQHTMFKSTDPCIAIGHINSSEILESFKMRKMPIVQIKPVGSIIKWPWSSANAYVDAPMGPINLKRYYLRSATTIQLAGTIIHELFHVHGFRHPAACSEERDYSIPYVVDRVFEELLATPNIQ